MNTEKINIGIKYKKILDIENYRYFLPAGYELYVLIRSDLIPKEKDKTK